VPAALQGRGLAAALVQAALAWARAERLRPTCSYVAAYMRRHPDTQDLLAPRG
jgi:predicted GNAT family acetyltransferase